MPIGPAFNVTGLPEQIIDGPLGEIVAVGVGIVLTLTITGSEELEQPPIVTVYIYEPVIEAVVEGVVAPVIVHRPVPVPDGLVAINT